MFTLYKDKFSDKRYSIIPVFIESEIIISETNYSNWWRKLSDYINSFGRNRHGINWRSDFSKYYFQHITMIDCIVAIKEKAYLSIYPTDSEVYELAKFWRLIDEDYMRQKIIDYSSYMDSISLKSDVV